jgi:hypothetical protein
MSNKRGTVFGIKLDQGRLLALLDEIQNSTPRGYACYVPIWRLSEWLSKYDSLGFAPHWRISIDPHCIGRADPGGFEVRVLELTMFEDMASLFNMAKKAHLAITAGKTNSKADLKGAFALYRSAVSASFYFVESFMNGLAADHVWQHRGELSPNDLACLTEWDPQRQRRKTLTTKEKLVKYPRIITGSQSPPLHEDNCAELKFIVTEGKRFRDAIVHPSAAKANEEQQFEKEAALMRLKYEAVEATVDSSIVLIRKIHAIVRPTAELKWVVPRGTDGFFPASVFE